MLRILKNVCSCNIQRVASNVTQNKAAIYTSLKERSFSSWNGVRGTYLWQRNFCRQDVVFLQLFPQRYGQIRSYSVFFRHPPYSRTRNSKSLIPISIRNISEYQQTLQLKHKTVLIYLTTVAIAAVGFSYASVPLYRLYCQATGYGGTTKKADIGDDIAGMERIEDRLLTIRFEAATGRTLQWKFKPQQKEVIVAPGETALAFYTAENLTEKPIIGISTYNVIPFDAGQYFNKIQCFCFEEQQLNPNEEVDMPVFFYIDPEIDEDPRMAKVDEIILSYTFFESSDGQAPTNTPHAIK